ncbi:hypothetical protein TNCV_2728141 [Trichonephila clavipes]|nr:hypothetical protein TNCV_2728141 [Trichonephila clavipes]
MRAIVDGPQNFEPQVRDEDTSVGAFLSKLSHHCNGREIKQVGVTSNPSDSGRGNALTQNSLVDFTNPNYARWGSKKYNLSRQEEITLSKSPLYAHGRSTKKLTSLVERTILLERRQSESVGRRNSRTTFLRSDWPRPFARREVGVEMELGRSENKRPEQKEILN